MSDDPAADLQSSRVIERAQAQIEAAARAQRDAKWDGAIREMEFRMSESKKKTSIDDGTKKTS